MELQMRYLHKVVEKFSYLFIFLIRFGCFFYKGHRTKENVFKSLQFALYWLAIKSGLIGANLPLKFDQYQPTHQLVSRTGYNHYVSFLGDYCPSGLYMDKFEQPVSQHYFYMILNQ